MPLSLVIVRYFAYILVALALVWAAAFAAFVALINCGAVLPANYGAAHAAEVASGLSQAASFDAESVPTAYRWALYDAEGNVAGATMSPHQMEEAGRLLLSGEWQGPVAPVAGSGGVTYVACTLADGTTCVLSSAYMPQFADHSLAQALPNPQDLLLAVGCAGSVLAVMAVARRASRVLARKMEPLAQAARRIADEDLDFSVGSTNVRQINEVLGAVEAMRASLQESLAARWSAEQAQRDQVAALAHDLKTPLTVVRANAEYLADELGGGRDLPEAVRQDACAAARDVAEGARRLDAYVAALLGLARDGSAPAHLERLEAVRVAAGLEPQARALAHARGVELSWTCGVAEGVLVRVDQASFERAVMNVVSNAIDHAGGRVQVEWNFAGAQAGSAGSVRVVVRDDGPGFSPAALEHGCERFFRDDASRSSGKRALADSSSVCDASSVAYEQDASAADVAGGAHFGLGLFTAREVMAAHGGALALANAQDAAGTSEGAVVTLSVPCLTARA